MQRDAFLARLRSRAGADQKGPLEAVPRRPVQSLRLDNAGRVSLFVERLEALGVIVEETATLEAARLAVEGLSTQRGWTSVACAQDTRWPGIRDRWVDDATHAQFGLCAAESGIAGTGTVVLRHGGESRPGHRRRSRGRTARPRRRDD